MPYQRADLQLDENADWTLSKSGNPPAVWTWLDPTGSIVNLTGYTAQLMVRQDRADAAPLLTLTQGGGVTLGGVLGTIDVTFTQAQVNALVTALLAKRLVAFYDLLLTSGTSVHTRFSEGLIGIDRAATR